MKLKIKHFCQNCGNIEYEKKSVWNTTKKVIRKFLFGWIIIFAIIGSIVIYNFIAMKSWDNPNLLFSTGTLYSFVQGITANFQDSPEISQLSQNLTLSCQDDECKAKKIFDYLSTFRYEEGTDINDPHKILTEKACDCDECSYTFELMTASLGIKSKLECTMNHCWDKIFLKDKTIHADIVSGEWKEE